MSGAWERLYKERLQELVHLTDNLLDKWLLWKASLSSPWTFVLCLMQCFVLIALGYFWRG